MVQNFNLVIIVIVIVAVVVSADRSQSYVFHWMRTGGKNHMHTCALYDLSIPFSFNFSTISLLSQYDSASATANHHRCYCNVMFLFFYEVSALFAVIYLHCSFPLAAADFIVVAVDCSISRYCAPVSHALTQIRMYFNCIRLWMVSNLFLYSSHESYGILTHDVKLSQTISTIRAQSSCCCCFFFSLLQSCSALLLLLQFLLFIVQLFLFRLKTASRNRIEQHGFESRMAKGLLKTIYFSSVICVNWKAVLAFLRITKQPKVKKSIIFKNNFHFFFLFIDVFIDEINKEKIVVYRLAAGEVTTKKVIWMCSSHFREFTWL